MRLRPLFFLILLAQQSALHGQAMDAISQKGDDALANGLWELAEMHFRRCLADPAITPDGKSQMAIRLAESLIRGNHPTEALDLLGQSFVVKNPEALFWKGQALAGLRRFQDAIGIFSTLVENPAAPHHTEAGLTQASLQLALGQTEAALGTLSKLIPNSTAPESVEIRLYQVEILLDLKRPLEARAKMPTKESVAEEDLPLASFLEARLMLEEGHPAEARAQFQLLVNDSRGQSLERYHAAAIGLADAIQALGDPETASKSLLTFIQDHPESPLLESMFKRVLTWLPLKPAATDPILDTLAQWITPPPLPAIGHIATNEANSGSEIISAWPTYAPRATLTDRLAFSLYTRAIGLHRIATPESRAEAKRLMNRLRVEYPDHLLASRTLYQSARWLLDEGLGEQAFSLLDTLRETAGSSILKGEAAFLEARAAFLNGNSKQAIQLFDEAALSLAAPEARTAKLQAAIARLRSGDAKGPMLIQSQGTAPDKELEADFEIERALSTTPPAAARIAIEGFLNRFPDHPRSAEALLAAVEAALASPTPDLKFATDKLESLSANPGNFASRIALARLRVADLSKDSAGAMTLAQSIIDTYPADSAEAAFILGRNLFQTGSYNPARLVLEKLAASDANPARAQAAWLLAARSAALGGTPQSKEEALILFDKAIAAKGSLLPISMLEKAGHLIDMSRLAEASGFLMKWMKTLPESDPLQLPAGLLLGETLYAQGSGNPASLVEALAVYDKLLAHAKDQPALLNRLQYLRGMTLEQVPDAKDPSKRREGNALQAYYSVLETTTPPTEWEYFERCGFSALALLEKAKRWQAAVNVAQKIASFRGPRAEEAAARASKIQLDQMIW